jgi:uncharacterized protein YegL
VFEVETTGGAVERSVRWKGPVEPGGGADLSPAYSDHLCYSRVLQDLLRPDQKYWANRGGSGDLSARNDRGGARKPESFDEGSTDLTDITVILDASGSMSHIKESTIEGFNDFLGDQREQEGDVRITLIQFDDEIEELWVDRPLSEAFELDEGHYVTAGRTALNDAVGKGIQEAKARAARANEERQSLYVVVTDGHENASEEFSHSDIQDMIESEREEGREFIFLAANQNAMKTADSYGMDPSKSMTYAHNDAGNKAAYSSTSRVVNAVRSDDASMKASFTSEERQEQRDAGADHDLVNKVRGAEGQNLNGMNDETNGAAPELSEKKYVTELRTSSTRTRWDKSCPSWDTPLQCSSCNEKSGHVVRRARARGSPSSRMSRVRSHRVCCAGPVGRVCVPAGQSTSKRSRREGRGVRCVDEAGG